MATNRRAAPARADTRSPLTLSAVIGLTLEARICELVQYENSYRLCYVRGPEGILVALAEKIG